MKVAMNKEYKRYFTIEDVEKSKMVIGFMKEDEGSIKDYAEYAINEAMKNTGHYVWKILEATAETAKNNRVWNAYSDESQDMDVWIEATARTTEGFIEIGAYLSDIWQTGAIEYKQHMYIERYTRS